MHGPLHRRQENYRGISRMVFTPLLLASRQTLSRYYFIAYGFIAYGQKGSTRQCPAPCWVQARL